MNKETMPWPRLARFDEKAPPLGVYQQGPDKPIYLVQCGNPVNFLAQINGPELKRFCNNFGFQYPPYFQEDNNVIEVPKIG